MKIEQDLHIHTNLSLCADKNATVESYIPAFHSAGITTCGIANHFWDEHIPGAIEWYQKQDFAHISEIKKDWSKGQENGLRFLFGAEAEYSLAMRGPAVTEETAEKLDFMIVPNSHTHITMPKEYYADHQQHADFMYQAFMDILSSPVAQWITAIAHPFEAVCCPYPSEELLPLIGETRFCKAFELAVEKKIAMEINMSIFRECSIGQMEKSNFMQMFRLAKKCGCQFTFGSDAHEASAISKMEKGYIAAELLDLKETDIRKV